MYTCSLCFICNNKVAMARARCGLGVNILYTQDTSLEVSFPCSLAPSFPRAIPPPLASSLPPAAHASPRSFLACSQHQPSLPQPSLPSLTLRACVASLLPLSLPLLSLPPSFSPSLPLFPLPPSPCSLPSLPSPFPPLPLPSHLLFSPRPFPVSHHRFLPPSHPLFPPSLPPSILPRSFPAPRCLLASCRATQYTVCVYSVCELHWLLFREGQPCVALRQWRGRAISRWLAVTLATHPPPQIHFFTNSKKIRDRHVHQTRHKHS